MTKRGHSNSDAAAHYNTDTSYTMRTRANTVSATGYQTTEVDTGTDDQPHYGGLSQLASPPHKEIYMDAFPPNITTASTSRIVSGGSNTDKHNTDSSKTDITKSDILNQNSAKQFIPPSTQPPYRETHSLLGIAKCIPMHKRITAARRHPDNLFVKIVDQSSGAVFAYEVPKAMLRLFIGRGVVNQFLRTTARDQHGNATAQELVMPPNSTSQNAIKILVSWMVRACQPSEGLRDFSVPDDIFVAITLASTLRILGCMTDADRVAHAFSRPSLQRPIRAQELKAIWYFLPETSPDMWAIVEVLKTNLVDIYNSGESSYSLHTANIYDVLEQEPELYARVSIDGYNDQCCPEVMYKCD